MGLDFERLGVLAQAVHAGCGTPPPTQTVLGVTALAAPDILFEIEAVATPFLTPPPCAEARLHAR